MSLLPITSVVGAFGYRAIATLEPFENDVIVPVTGITMGPCFGLLVRVVAVVTREQRSAVTEDICRS
ncbi:hypothetical protein SAMN04515672_1591 [Natronorubrum texcoconense]|uniref:Uncharacterized protein n=1 Tax=Natronorubrum texcoconense TaxID=1095776 RepID=A0A1G8X4H5_9EURY|nr:hypothetical protein SAMN04515672_1591 [Natronorubrum texcoconense]